MPLPCPKVTTPGVLARVAMDVVAVAHLNEHDLEGRQADAIVVAFPVRIDPAAIKR